jgi:hypothetical protein
MNDSNIFSYLDYSTSYTCWETFMTFEYNTSKGVGQRGIIHSTSTYTSSPVCLKDIVEQKLFNKKYNFWTKSKF